MKPIKAIYTLLSSDINITANVYPQRIPEGAALPAIALNQISRIGNDTKKEYSKSDIARIQVTIVAETATQGYELSELVRNAMSATLPGVYNEILVQNIAFENEQTLVDDRANEQGVFMVAQDYFVMVYNTLITSDSLLLESGDFLLLEDGDKILL